MRITWRDILRMSCRMVAERQETMLWVCRLFLLYGRIHVSRGENGKI